jgi:hypothetical protein
MGDHSETETTDSCFGNCNNKTLSALESPFSLCNLSEREKERRVVLYIYQNLNTCSFVPCGKQTSACILEAVMATSNRSNHFGTPCIILIDFSDFSRNHLDIDLYLICCTWLPEVFKRSVSNYFRARTNLITTTDASRS